MHAIVMGRLVWVQKLIWASLIVLGEMNINGCRGCIEKERQGLLELKAFLMDDSGLEWSNEGKSDCCRWERVKCDLTSGRVIGLSLNESMYSTRKLLLNVSLLYPFEELQEFNLSTNYFVGFFDTNQGYQSLGRLKKLKLLDLSSNGFKNSILTFLNVALPLETLILRENNLDGPFPLKDLKGLGSLQVLDLSQNNFNESLPAQDLVDLNKLRALDLSDNKFSGLLKEKGICELKILEELDLSKNEFIGEVPQCVGSLKKLRLIDLSSNQLSGELPSRVRNLKSLGYLSLSNNRFEGSFSFSLLANLSELKVFKLSSEPSLSHLLHVETESLWRPKFQLSAITLSGRNLRKIPSFLLYQKDLRLIDLSNNRLFGEFPTRILENNPRLEVLLLANNSFTSLQLPKFMLDLQVLDVSDNDLDGLLPENIGQILPYIRHMNLSNNGFLGSMPSSLGEMKDMFLLDLSHNNFSGKLSENFVMGCYSLDILKLSQNNLTGKIFPKPTNLTSLRILQIDNNKFFGKLEDAFLNSSMLEVLDISNNFLIGAIPRWMANFTSLGIFLMSNNFLEGTIPILKTHILDLSGNRLSGALPSRFSSNDLSEHRLYLQNNDLTGSIPDTLLENVIMLDLRNNKLSGDIPHFVNTQNISILLLRKNHLTGHIRKNLCELSNIRLLDLAYNQLSGAIPSCLNNISFGSRSDTKPYFFNYWVDFSINYGQPGKYFESILLVDQLSPYYNATLNANIQFAAKQRYYSYTGRALDYTSVLDLSSNELSGEIPTELGDLQNLLVLNLSHNNLSGSIPESFFNMKDMESVDLSFNRLSGKIPPQVTKLDFLSNFNVSYNNLSGTVPQDGHSITLDESNYIGNPLLCGLSANRSCNPNSSEVPYTNNGRKDDDEAAIDMVAFGWSFGATYVIVLMGILLFLCFDSNWSFAWFRLVDAFISSVKSMWS